jgi:DNA polymerase I-like protein with 3'-5' exonuclease and polymerase domains
MNSLLVVGLGADRPDDPHVGKILGEYGWEGTSYPTPLPPATTLHLLGKGATQAFLGKKADVMRLHGTVLTRGEVDEIQKSCDHTGVLPEGAKTLVVSLHPAFAVSRGIPQMRLQIQQVIARAKRWAELGTEPTRPAFIPSPLEDVLSARSIVIDVETPMYEFTPIELVGFASSRGVAVCKWTPEVAERIRRLMGQEKNIVMHNAMFDLRALGVDGIEPSPSVTLVDTMITEQLINPMPTGGRQVRWFSLDTCVLRHFDGFFRWKDTSHPITQAIYQVAWPHVRPQDWPALYNYLDVVQTLRLYKRQIELVDHLGMTSLVREIIAPCIPTLSRMEKVGIPLDEATRERIRIDVTRRLNEATSEVATLLAPRYARRVDPIRVRVQELQGITEAPFEHPLADRCFSHPEYDGRTIRSKCVGCRGVCERSSGLRQVRAGQQSTLTIQRTLLKRLGNEFDATNNDHWRWVLYAPEEEGGYGLKVRYHTETNLPSVDEKAIEALTRKYPSNPVLSFRHTIASCNTRLLTRLAVKAEADGNVHFAYSMHRTSTGRVASGEDADDEDTFRASPGNGMNLPVQDRVMYVAPPGEVMLQADYKAIEAFVYAQFAGCRKLLDAMWGGVDIHARNAHVIASAIGFPLREGDEDTTPFPNDPQGKSFRQAGKLTHKLHYGMGANRFSRDYGIPYATCVKIIEAYFAEWEGLREMWVTECEAAMAGRLFNPFNHLLRFVAKKKERGEWVVAERNEVLAWRTQGTVARMGQVMLPKVDKAACDFGGRLRHFGHDSFMLTVPESRLTDAAKLIKILLEAKWPVIAPDFWVPVSIKAGVNWLDLKEVV